MRSQEEISDVLSQPIPSATQIINDGESILAALHQDIQEATQRRSGAGASTNLMNLMTNMTQQLEDYQAESSMGPALHAARQVAYWSSVFVSMMSNDAATIPSTTSVCHSASNQLVSSIATTSAIASHQPPVSFPSGSIVSNHQATPGMPATVFVSGPHATSSALTTSAIASHQPPVSFPSGSVVSNHEATPGMPATVFVSGPHATSSALTTSVIASHQAPVSLPSGSVVSNHEATPGMPATVFVSGPHATSSALTTSAIARRQPPVSLPSGSVVSSHKATLGTPATVFVSSHHATPPITTTSVVSTHCATASLPAAGFISSALSIPSNQPTFPFPTINPGNQPTSSIPITDPATILMFREYGSGSLPEWLNSLTIPRNVDSLQQVKELWETGAVKCPPLCKWTVVMRNHRSPKAGKNSSLFSQRKFMYNFFKNNNFDENIVSAKYSEVRPGKLYKILNSRNK